MVSFRDLWANHPTNTGEQYPCQTNGTSNFANQCAIRMGVCLKKAGVAPASIRDTLYCAGAQSTGHDNNEMHIIRAAELARAINVANIPGVAPYIKLNKPDDFANEIKGRKGIIYFEGYWWRPTDTTRRTGDHIDLWNGWRTTAKVLLPWFGWLGGYDISGQIWFWEVKG